MSNSVQQVNKTTSGLCPHGLSPGACPICSNMGGGGRAGERPQKAGEMSYHQCAIIGAMMKARQQRIDNHQKNLLSHAQKVLEFEQNMQKLIEQMQIFTNKIAQNFFAKPLAFGISKFVIPTVVLAKNIVLTAMNLKDFALQLKQKFADIQDKLNAIFGEMKAFAEKKVSELISVVKSKFKSLFKIFKKHNTDNEDTKIDDDKKIFNLKTILHKIINRKKKNGNEN